MSEYVLEKGIVFDKPASLRELLNQAEPGDSVFVAGKKKAFVYTLVTLLNRENPGKKFKSRVQEGGYRIWRIT